MKTLLNFLQILHKHKILYFLPLLFIIPALLRMITAEIVIFPGRFAERCFAYSDSSMHEGNGGNSAINEFKVTDNQIKFSYTLKTQYQYPYAGFNINLMDGNDFFDVSDYDCVSIKLENSDARALRILIRTFLDGFTKMNEYLTYRHIIKEVELLKDRNEYTFRLDEIKTALWWYQEFNLTEAKVGKVDNTKVIDIEFESGELAPNNIPQSITISKISFLKDNTAWYIITIFLIVAYYFVYFSIFVIYRKIKTPVVISYKKLEIENYLDEDTRIIVEEIASEYTNSMLTISSLAQKTGRSPSKISATLQKQFKSTFKQYLNSIRLAEATRLLKETDRQVSEIALRVGYSNVTHFNRVFKKVYKTSPNEFRKM